MPGFHKSPVTTISGVVAVILLFFGNLSLFSQETENTDTTANVFKNSPRPLTHT